MATSMAANEKMGWPRRNLRPGHNNSGQRYAVAAVARQRRRHSQQQQGDLRSHIEEKEKARSDHKGDQCGDQGQQHVNK